MIVKRCKFILVTTVHTVHMTDYAGPRNYAENLQSSWRTPHSDPLVASSVHRTPAQNLQREGRSLPPEGRDHLFQWDVGISVGFSTETTLQVPYVIPRPGVPRHMLHMVLYINNFWRQEHFLRKVTKGSRKKKFFS